MGAALFALVSAGLIGGFGLIAAGMKSTKPITFPDSFYENLNYFKMEGKFVYAVRNDGSEEEIYNGKSAEKYFAQVQLGFEKWLKDNNHSNKDKSGSVEFS